MSDDNEFDRILRKIRQEETEQRKNARQVLADACQRLTELGVTQLQIAYDGYGDSGNIESVTAFVGEEEVQLSSEIDAALQDAACNLLPLGWEIGDGSYGELIVEVAARTVTRQHSWRSTEYGEEEFKL